MNMVDFISKYGESIWEINGITFGKTWKKMWKTQGLPGKRIFK